tara:strand:- start:248 stop:1105 length:858 start_codon:yes stop_codon:yes gene_type:complete
MCLLSICIPTFNREQNLKRMLNSINLNPNIEIIICDDGSTDNTNQLVKDFNKFSKIKYIFQKNSGVSAAMLNAYQNASGEYVIKMDSDDIFTKNGLNFILETLKNNPKNDAFLYGVETIKNNISSKNLPPNRVTNYISVRADLNIKGDLKEVVRREIVLKYMYKVPSNVKRIPPGLLWIKIAEDYNCISFKNVVAIKSYLDEGITSRMLYLKTSYPAAMVELYERLSKSKVYKSLLYRWRSRILWARYSFHNRSIKIKSWWHLLVYVPSWFIYKFDRLRIKINND